MFNCQYSTMYTNLKTILIRFKDMLSGTKYLQEDKLF